MATRQRSFFDQKPQSHRRPFPPKGYAPQYHRPPPPLPPKYDPVKISTQSRSKLNALKFVQDNPPMEDEDGPQLDQENAKPGESDDDVSQPWQSQELDKAPQASAHEYPQTPLGRVPLRDLMNDEGTSQKSPQQTPMDRVEWCRSPSGSEEPCSLATPMAKRGKKRAHSSSPISSQKQEAPAKTSFSLQNLQSSLASDPADPALDLEKRYFSRAKVETPQRPPASAAADFMHSSSPRTPALSSGGSSKLRRTVSCGIEWPERKRRKVTKAAPSVSNEQSRVDEVAQLRNEAGLIPRILEQLQPDLPSAWHEIENLPSSAPQVPKASLGGLPSRQEPKVATQRLERQSARSSVTLAAMILGSEVLSQAQPTPRGSSEFNDDELERSFMSAIESPVPQPTSSGHARVKEQPNAHVGHAVSNHSRSQGMHSACDPQTKTAAITGFALAAQNVPSEEASLTPHPRSAVDEDEDEFSDPDLFAADFESLAKMYDTQEAQEARSVDKSVEENTRASPQQPPSQIKAVAEVQAVPRQKKDLVEISSDEDFDDGIDFDAVMKEYERGTQAGEPSKKDPRPSTIQRYLIVSISDGQYEDSHGHVHPEKVMLVKDEKSGTQKAVTLRQSWFDSPCTPGSCIHVVGSFDRAGQCIMDDAQNYLVLHPDHLISATVVADSFTCTRRAVLQDRVKATSSANEAQVYGHIIHEIFQEAMKANRWDLEWLSSLVARICSRYLEALHEIRVETTAAIEHLVGKVPELQAWAALFLVKQPKANAVVRDRNGVSTIMSVNKLLDVEEHVWSPTYGLKGNIDATIQVAMVDDQGRRTLTVPLELKTGKNTTSTSHKAQTALYTLLLSDRYDIEVTYGILYYLETSETSRVSGIRHELLHMIKQRNVLACYVRDRAELPPMLKDPRMCGKCYAQKACFIYHKLVDDGNASSSGLKERFNELMSHLSPLHQEFFTRWDNLLTKEETDLLKYRRELWTMSSLEREKVGRCFADLAIVEGSAVELKDSPKINRFKYSLKKGNSPYFSFTDSQITVGEPIVISDERGHFALANGYVTNLTKHRITVAVDRQLHNARTRTKGFDELRNQSFVGVMQIGADDDGCSIVDPEDSSIPVTYRLDKDEFSNGMATARNNLIRIMENDTVSSSSLRRLVVEHMPPIFEQSKNNEVQALPNVPGHLNVDQRNAIEKVMSAKDYALVLGMPGTGKTTTIAQIIRALTAKGKSVLLTSYTHTAVDNILLKIQDDGIEVLRIGAVAKVHPQVQAFAHLASEPKTTHEQLTRSYNSQVVATTCLGINHPVFNERLFDYCIVDEASQITLPVCLGPIRMAKTFVLVGDHYQLPPLVQNKQAREGGLDVSLFKLLSDRHPESVVNLEHQYRMCEDIMSLSNTLIYGGRLKCGTNEVAERAVDIPNMPALKQHHHTASTITSGQTAFCLGPSHGRCWLRDVLDPASRVVFLNTDPLRPSLEIAKGPRLTNPVEVAIATQIVDALLTVGAPASDIGVITLYRSQLALLKQSLRCQSSFGGVAEGANGRAGAVEMHTADKFQGRDKEVVVLSLVRSNESNNVGDLLQDWRRLNVALTRARTKMIIIGSLGTISKGNELLSAFCHMVEQKGWRRDLKPGSLDEHLFDDFATQMSEAPSKAREAVVRKETGVNSGGKAPTKVGKTDPRRLMKNRPVMRDILNDVMS